MHERNAILTEIIAIANILHRQMFMRLRATFKDFSLSGPQAHLLMAIAHHMPVSSAQLAHSLHLTAGAVSQSLEALESAGLAERQADPNDRRVELISLTAAGRAKVRMVEQKRGELIGDSLKALSDDELRQYLSLQQKIQAALAKEVSDV